MNYSNKISTEQPRSTDHELSAYELNFYQEDDFEELQEETPWEIFASEINNWSPRHCSSGDFASI